MRHIVFGLFLVLGLVSLSACIGENGKTARIQVHPEPAGAHCEDGGIEILAGLDDNENGLLDTEEVTQKTYVCNGEDGSQALVDVTELQPGSACPEGGQRITTGIDADQNGQLDPSETQNSQVVCDGIGTDGVDSIIHQTSLPKGSSQCLGGGVMIESGQDLDQDGNLDAGEVQESTTLCTPLICDRTARFSMDTLAACPEEEAYAGLSSGYINALASLSAVTDSGDLFIRTGAAPDVIAKVAQNGTVQADWYVGPAAGTYLADLAAVGNTLYMISPEYQKNLIRAFDVSQGTTWALMQMPSGSLYENVMAVFSSSQIYFGGNVGGSTALWEFTPAGNVKVLPSGVSAQDMVADPVRNRIYWVTPMNEIYYLALPITPSSAPVLLANVGIPSGFVDVNGKFNILGSLTVDHNGNVYVSCSAEDVNTQALGLPCVGEVSVWRINGKNGEVSPLIKNTMAVTGLAYNRARHQLHMIRIDKRNGLFNYEYHVERVDILR